MNFKRKRANKYLKIYNMNQKIKANIPTFLALREQISDNQVEFYDVSQKMIRLDEHRGKEIVNLMCKLTDLNTKRTASHTFVVMGMIVLVPFLYKIFLE